MSADSPLFSPYWYKVGRVMPRLRPGVRLTRREEQGEVWHILSAPESNRHFRLDAASYALISALDGRQPLDTIWRRVLARFGDAAPGQDEAIRLLGQLHQADALNAGTAPTLAEFGQRARRMQRQKLMGRLKSPLFVRVPLFDPKPLIEATYPLVRPLFSLPGFLTWLAVVLWLAVQAVANWQALTGAVLDRALSADNLVVALLVFPFAKALHEMSHGWAVRHWGGEVREFGIMFLVFLPAPYVDASDATSFRARRARLVVGGAGMMAEALLAALAMLVWLESEPGLARAIAFNTMLIASVSTLLFNGNPLLRFDAYFMLSDLIGVQNLAGRAQKWWGWLLHRFGFGIQAWDNPARTAAEARWFAFYHPASYAYRIFLTLSIALFVAQKYRVIGLGLATWSVSTTIAFPAALGLWHLMTAPALTGQRRRAWAVSGLVFGLPLALLALVPLPHGTVAPGVVIAPDSARIAAPVDARISHVLTRSGERVAARDILATLDAPLADNRLALIEARIASARARLSIFEAAPTGTDEAIAARARIAYLEQERSEARADLEQLVLLAGQGGRFVAREPVLLPGRRLSEGAEIGFLVPQDGGALIRVAVPASRIDLVASSAPTVSVYMPGGGFAPVAGMTDAIAPEATRQLDFPTLSQVAGGPLVMDPTDQAGRRTAQPFHMAEIGTAVPYDKLAVGALVWVRFDHGYAPLLPRLWRLARQTFLSRLAL